MGASRITSDFLVVLKQEAGLQSYIRPVVQACKPAGPDGIRRRGSHLQIELDALADYRSFLVPVQPVCPITTSGRLLSFKAIGHFA